MKVGILGAAKIAPSAVVEPARKIEGVEVVAVAARDPERAKTFAREQGGLGVMGSYQELCDSPEVDVVYNALPISHHCQWTVRALRAGKAVLCEKAFAANADEAAQMASAASETGRLLAEAFHWRYHPLADRMIAIVREGRLGRIHSMRSHFDAPIGDWNDIRFNYETAGGATMDLGCYPVHMLRHLTGEEPKVVRADAEVGPPEVDIAMTAELQFPSGATAEISCRMKPEVDFRMGLSIRGDRGRMEVTNPLVPHFGHEIAVETGGQRESITVDGDTTYTHQLRAFAQAWRDGSRLPTHPDDAVANMVVLDGIYRQAGLRRRGESTARDEGA